LKVLLHFGLRRWEPVDFAVVVNEGQVLALLVGIEFFIAGYDRVADWPMGGCNQR